MKMPIKCTWVSSYWAICRTRISALFALRLKSAKTRATPPQSLRFNSIGNRKMSPNIETKCYLNLRQKCHPNLSPHDRTAQGFSAPWKGRVDPVGGRYPTRQLLLQPEAVGAWRTGNGPWRSLRCKRSSAAGSASTQPLMRMNTEQASKRAMWTPRLLKQDEGRSLGVKRATGAAPRAAGVLVRGCEHRIAAVNTGDPSWWGARPQLKNREVWNRPAGESERFIVAKNRVTIEERRDLSSRSTQKQQEPGRLMSV